MKTKRPAWQQVAAYKGVPIYRRKTDTGLAGGAWKAGAACWPSQDRARQYVDELEAAGLLAVHAKKI